MNIVQIANDIKGYPLELLKQYANGANPEIPPYIALGEIERQNKMHERSAMQQQSAQGPQPSVKEQIEQKAGLMALQAQQQQQAQQQMMQQARSQPMPVPAGVPQPAQQAQENFADGGMAQLPIGSEFFQYGSGGIISFESGGKTARKLPKEEMPYYGLISDQEDQSDAERQRLMFAEQEAREKMGKPFYSAAGTSLVNSPRDVAQPTPPNQLDPAFMAAARESVNVQSPETIMQNQIKMRELSGIQGLAGQKAEEGVNRQREMYKEATANRGIEGLMAVLGGIKQGSLGGAGPAYLGQKSAERTADLAQLEKENKLTSDIEEKRRAEASGLASTGIASLEKQRTEAGTTGRTFAVEAMRAGNELEREKARFANELELAKGRFANDKELAEIRAKHEVRLEGVRAGSAMALEKFRQDAPTINKKDFDDYYRLFKADPKNRDRTEADAFAQYHVDKYAGRGQSASEANEIKRLKLATDNPTYLSDKNIAKNDPDPEKRRKAQARIDVLEETVGITPSSAIPSEPPPGAVRVRP